jgi:Malic enzyme, NAD binding domain
MTVPLAMKDLLLPLAAAEHSTVPMPLASLLQDWLVAVEARGWSELDWSSLGKLAAFEAGLPEERITDEMFIEGAHGAADQVTPEQLKHGLLYPPQSNISETEVRTAERVASLVFE